MTPDSDRRDTMAIYSKKTVQELNVDIPDFLWMPYLEGIMEAAEDSTIEITDQENVVIYGTKYLKEVVKIVNDSME